MASFTFETVPRAISALRASIIPPTNLKDMGIRKKKMRPMSHHPLRFNRMLQMKSESTPFKSIVNGIPERSRHQDNGRLSHTGGTCNRHRSFLCPDGRHVKKLVGPH